MKQAFVFLLSILCSFTLRASPGSDSLLPELNKAIQLAESYDSAKLAAVAHLKEQLSQTGAPRLNREYEITLRLYEEYKYYNYDSALLYAQKLQWLASEKNDQPLFTDAKLKLAFILLSGGMFKETFDSLNQVSISNLHDSIKSEYYTLVGRAYFNLADFNSDNHSTPLYNNKAILYLDSALALYPPKSFEYLYYASLKFLKKGKPDSALSNLLALTARNDLSQHQVALATSTIGGIYLRKGDEDQAKPFLIRASLADIRSSTKETLALLTLAGIIYKEGKIEEAVLYVEKANADASFYNARLRKVQVGAVLPLIEGEMIHTIQVQKQRLVIYLALLGLLLILLAGFAIIIRKQLTKLKAARLSLMQANANQQKVNGELVEANNLKEKYNTQLIETNSQLVEANSIKEKYNEQLQYINHQLTEANKIKEEYIGYYFSMDTEFIGRIEKLINAIDKKLVDRKWEEIKFIVKGVDLKKEKEALLLSFDKVFVRLFPNFVNQFNTLFAEEDKIVLKDDQLLTSDLRIFALMRLGITENEKIAEILDYSINTIYSKKTKIRNKTIVSKEELEKKIMEITTISF